MIFTNMSPEDFWAMVGFVAFMQLFLWMAAWGFGFNAGQKAAMENRK